jgi:hypothetical protein
MFVALCAAFVSGLSAAGSSLLAGPARAASPEPAGYLQLSFNTWEGEVTKPSASGALDDVEGALRYACLPGSIDSTGNSSAYSDEVSVTPAGTVTGNRVLEGKTANTSSKCVGTLGGSASPSSGAISLSGTTTWTETINSGTAQGSYSKVTTFTITASAEPQEVAVGGADIAAETTFSHRATSSGNPPYDFTFEGKVPVTLRFRRSGGGAALAETLRVGLACDTKDLDATGTVVCTAAPEGAVAAARLVYRWQVEGVAQGVSGPFLPVRDVPRGATYRISVSVSDAVAGTSSPRAEVSVTRPLTPGGGGDLTPVILVAGAAVAVALAVGAVRSQRSRRPLPVPDSGPPNAKQDAPSQGPWVLVRVAAETSAFTRGRYGDGQARIFGDDADVAQARCHWRVEPATTQVVGDPTFTWAVTFGTGKVVGGHATDAYGNLAVGDASSCVVRAGWTDSHQWLQVTATVGVTVVGSDGKQKTIKGSGIAALVVIGSTAAAQLEVAPAGPYDLDGTTELTVVPSLFLFDTLFPGEVEITEIPSAQPSTISPTTLTPAEALDDWLERIEGSGPAQGGASLGRPAAPLGPAPRAHYRLRLSLFDPADPLRVVATVRPKATPLGARHLQTKIDPIVDRHIANCAAAVRSVRTEALVLQVHPVEARLAALDPELPVNPPASKDEWSPRARLRLRLRTRGGRDVADQDAARDLLRPGLPDWEVTYRFCRVVSECARAKGVWIDDPDSYAEQRMLMPTGTVRGGCLVISDPSRPAGFDDRDIVYDHDTSFRGPEGKYEPMRGDGGVVDTRATFGSVSIAGDPVAIRLEPFKEACAYIDANLRPGGMRPPLMEAIIAWRTDASRPAIFDPRLRWYQRNAPLEDWLKLVDYGELRHEFYPDLDPANHPRRCDRQSCTATNAYECHAYAWRPLGRISPGHISNGTIMRDYVAAKGYRELSRFEALQPSDVITFAQGESSWDAPNHSAVVTSVEEGRIICSSKDMTNSLFVHTLTRDPKTDYFFKEYGGYGLRYFRPTAKTLELAPRPPAPGPSASSVGPSHPPPRGGP